MSASAELSEPRRRLLQDLLSGAGARQRRPGDAVEPRPPGTDSPLSASQTQIYLHAAMAGAPTLYNEAVTIHRDGPFDLPTLERALNEVLRRHEIWRSGIEERDGRLRLVAHESVRLTLPLTDLSDLPQAEREAAATRLATEDARRPFDLAQAPLLRGQVVRLAPERHRLYLTLHHIVFDGVALCRVLMPELAALYAAFERGEPSPLPEPTLQYADYALWRERQVEGAAFERELAYWRETLAGEPPELVLPCDRPPSPQASCRGAMETFELTPALTARLKALAAGEGATLYATLLAAFKALLARYSGQDDLVIGGVTDMRRRPELEPVIGYFLNSVALRTRPRPQLAFRDYLAAVRTAVIEALDASSVPFDRVVRTLKRRRDGSRHPLFQVLFSIQPPAPAYAPGWDLTQMDVEVGAAKFDLYLELEERPDRLVGRFLYASDLFEAASVRRMIGHLTQVLEGIADDPGQRLADLPLLTEAEHAAQAARNRTEADYPRVPVHALVEAQAAQTPDAAAVACGGQSWSYAELEHRAEALADALAAAGAGPGALVGVAMARSCEMVAALLATLKTGAAYLPLDPALPQKRLAFMIEDAAPSVIVTDAASAARLPAGETAVVRADEARPASAGAQRPTVGADDLAYVLHTSGSTGRPKAVEVRHRSVANLLEAVRADIGFEAGDALLAVTTLSFDIAALELFLPLVAGGRLVIAPSEDAADPARLAALMARERCGVMQATPATWRALIAADWGGDPQLRALCGGEALQTELARGLLARCGALWNLYGPTETTIWSLIHRVRPEDDPVPIGRPLANTRIHVVDAYGTPVPDLAPGELLIAGEGVAAGYRGAPELTAAKFVALPTGEMAYRTGDRVRRRADGVVEFLGRVDNLVKIRGFRVGLEEVEAAIAQHPKVAAAAAAAWPDASGELALAGYVVGDLGPADVPDLRRALRETLPAYMVPGSFEVLPALPMTANGKIDRARLPRPGRAPPAASRPPREGVETELAALWRDVLGLEAVGAEDDFFDLGGHSLLAAALMAKLQARLGRTLPLATLFRAPTIAALARVIAAGDEAAFSHLVRLKDGAGRPLFIVHGIFGEVLQLRGLADQLATERPVYGIQARGVDLRLQPHASLAEMADAYVAAIREAQPHGPYALAGYSFGGLIAFETARRLRGAGEAVELLALLETSLYERFLPPADKLAYHLELASRALRRVRVLPIRALAPYLISKARQVCHRIALRLGVRDDFVTLDRLEGPAGERSRRMYQIGVRDFRAFRPARYDGRLSLFHIRGPRFDSCDPIPIWRRAARNIELFEIDGEHNRIMEKPYVITLAAQLSRRLAALDRGRAEPTFAPAALPTPAESEPCSIRLDPALLEDGAGGGWA